MSDEPSTKDLLKLLAPYLAGTACLAVLLVLALLKTVGLAGANVVTVSVVSFDVIKYTNAQRAVASSFLKPGADSSAGEVLLRLPERTREAIRDVAGAGTLVMLKQAVVQGQTQDITDAVLKKLGLPTNVPTADQAAYSLDVAPTMLQIPGVRETPRLPADRGPQVLP